jgi:predicted nucleotidyltransferase
MRAKRVDVDEAISLARSYARSLKLRLGADMEFVVLFGSRAQGTADEESDYDVAVFVPDHVNVWKVLGIASDIAYPYVISGKDLRPLVMRASRWAEPSDILNHIRTTGIRIS